IGHFGADVEVVAVVHDADVEREAVGLPKGRLLRLRARRPFAEEAVDLDRRALTRLLRLERSAHRDLGSRRAAFFAVAGAAERRETAFGRRELADRADLVFLLFSSVVLGRGSLR